MNWIIVLAYIVGALTSGIFTLINTWYQNRLNRKGKKKTTKYLYSVAQYNYHLNKTLFNIRNQLGASDIFLARFHNGGQFINGLKIDKFSITNESPRMNCEPVQHDFENVMFSRYSRTISTLLYSNRFEVPNTQGEDGLPRDIAQKGYRSMYVFLIKGLDDIPAGFVAVLFKNQTDLTEDQRQIVESHHNTILNYVNHTKPNI